MRLLLDECTPRRLGASLAPHEVSHVTKLGWSGVKNGALLASMRGAGFAGLITSDRNFSFQQSIASSGVFIIVLIARSNEINELRLLAPEILRTLEFAQPGQAYRVVSDRADR